jgi:uncharacterized protein YjbI with pentapeptide repeats
MKLCVAWCCVAAGLSLFASPATADVFQWEYINPADPSQGKRQSATLAPDGAGANAASGERLSYRDLRKAYLAGAELANSDLSSANLTDAYLAGANLTNANAFNSNLMDADFRGANLSNANFRAATLTDADFAGAQVRGATLARENDLGQWFGTGITIVQLYSTASYQSGDLSGVSLDADLSGANLAGKNLAGANLWGTLTGADFTGAQISRAGLAGITLAQLYSTASYQSHDLSGGLLGGDFSGGNFTRQDLNNAELVSAKLTGADLANAQLQRAFFNSTNLAGANFSAADARGASLDISTAAINRANLILPNGHIQGLELVAGGLLTVRDFDGADRFGRSRVPIPIAIQEHLSIDPDGTLGIVLDADSWDSTISFAAGIPVALAGTLELTFAADVNLAGQMGRTLDLFDWTGVTPAGAFTVSSPYVWDLSELYSSGEVTLTAIPEPASLLLTLAFGALSPVICRLRRRSPL